MAKIVNCTNQHVRILRTAKNGHLEVKRIFPAGLHSMLQLQPDEAECDLGDVMVQPVKSTILNRPDLTASDTAYIVGMDEAVSLAEGNGCACLLVPCDPFLVRKLPSHYDPDYVGEYELIPGGLMADDAVQARLDEGYKIYGYRRLLMVYADDAAKAYLGELANGLRGGKRKNQSRLREVVNAYWESYQKQPDSRITSLFATQSKVDVVSVDGTSWTFNLNDADVSRLLIYMDSLLQK